MKEYHKLVRDKVLDILKDKNLPYEFHIATTEEYKEKLYEKLLEEAQELKTDRSVEELADLLEVIEAIKTLEGFTTEEIERVRVEKNDARGSFTKGIILEKS